MPVIVSSWHGVFYLHILKHYDHKEYAETKASFARMIERHGTWPEMLNPDGSWYNAPIYKGDQVHGLGGTLYRSLAPFVTLIPDEKNRCVPSDSDLPRKSCGIFSKPLHASPRQTARDRRRDLRGYP